MFRNRAEVVEDDSPEPFFRPGPRKSLAVCSLLVVGYNSSLEIFKFCMAGVISLRPMHDNITCWPDTRSSDWRLGVRNWRISPFRECEGSTQIKLRRG